MSPRAADNIARKFVTQSVGFWHIATAAVLQLSGHGGRGLTFHRRAMAQAGVEPAGSLEIARTAGLERSRS